VVPDFPDAVQFVRFLPSDQAESLAHAYARREGRNGTVCVIDDLRVPWIVDKKGDKRALEELV
jgi:hypothetical protein